METYRLKSKLVEHNNEIVIQTVNDVNLGEIASTVYVNQEETERVSCPYPQSIAAEEVLSLVKLTHGERKKELETLLESYKKVHTSGDPELMYHLGVAFFYKRLHREAAELLEAATALQPEHHQAFNYLGMSLLALNKPTEAIECGTVAVQKRPGYADYRNNLGEALLANRSCREAIREFEEAIRINLYYGDAYLNLGLALVLNAVVDGKKGSLAEIVKRSSDCFNKAALIYPHYDAPTFDQGMEALQSADFRRAFAAFHRLREDKKEKHRRESAGFYLKFAMHPDCLTEEVVNDRIRYLKAEIEKNPTYIDLYAELGRCLLERAKFSWQHGLEQYRKTTEINPSLSRAQYCYEEAEREYENICTTLSRIIEKN
jgi:tetratricopeptide (TPR) repeat protein